MSALSMNYLATSVATTHNTRLNSLLSSSTNANLNTINSQGNEHPLTNNHKITANVHLASMLFNILPKHSFEKKNLIKFLISVRDQLKLPNLFNRTG